jgi:catechol 2,3-dioxygenase-like lactoylglutathione lyase family enzyme
MTGPSPRVSNVILRVSDLSRSVEFYRDGVGMTVRSASKEFAVIDAGGIALMLNEPENPPREPSAGLAALTEIVLEVPDVRSAHAALEKRGIVFKKDLRAVTSDGSRDLLATDFRDPDGHVLSLTGWVPAQKR